MARLFGLVCIIMVLAGCREDGDEMVGSVAGFSGDSGGYFGLVGHIPIYSEVWQPEKIGSTEFVLRGANLATEDSLTVSIGLQDRARAELHIIRNDRDALQAGIDVYSATGQRLGGTKHTYNTTVFDGDSVGMKIIVQHKKRRRYVYRLVPQVNGSARGKELRVNTSLPKSQDDGVHTSVFLPPPENGMIIFRNGVDIEGQCIGVRIKLPSNRVSAEVYPTSFEAEDERIISESENSELSASYQQCLQVKGGVN